MVRLYAFEPKVQEAVVNAPGAKQWRAVRSEVSTKTIDKVSQYLFRKLRGFFSLTEQIEQAIEELCVDMVQFRPRTLVIGQGETYKNLYLVERGWVLRGRDLPDGGRQIVNVAVPGDFLCFNAALFHTSDFDLMTKTEVSAFRFDRIAIDELFARYSALALALTWVSAHEESMLAERIVSLGRRNARKRLAHVLCEFAARLRVAGLVEDGVLPIPLTQEDFADLLGMSSIHVNRTLRTLAGDGLVHYKVGQVEILDLKGLELVAGFDKGYLHYTQRSDALRR